ncbi:MAG: hypothetical protein SFV21_18160 [Rhodospirillaceae bacterium]|nr:hypothetical protein [Rhodospirillaceae bacterium]
MLAALTSKPWRRWGWMQWGLGAVVALGLGAPLVLNTWSDQEIDQVRNLQAAIYDVQAAIGTVNRLGGAIDPAQADTVAALYEKAASAAAQVDAAVLARVHDELPEVWRDKFRKSTDMYVGAIRAHDRDGARQAALLQDDWIRWYNKNKRDMNIPDAAKAVVSADALPGAQRSGQ